MLSTYKAFSQYKTYEMLQQDKYVKNWVNVNKWRRNFSCSLYRFSVQSMTFWPLCYIFAFSFVFSQLNPINNTNSDLLFCQCRCLFVWMFVLLSKFNSWVRFHFSIWISGTGRTPACTFFFLNAIWFDGGNKLANKTKKNAEERGGTSSPTLSFFIFFLSYSKEHHVCYL